MKPETIAEAGTEHAHQAALFAQAAIAMAAGRYHELKWMHAIPNGSLRHAATAARLKAEGVRAGVSDVFLPCPRGDRCGLYIEMKRPAMGSKRQGAVTKEQKAFISDMRAAGYAAAVCVGWRDAWETIEHYMAGGKPCEK